MKFAAAQTKFLSPSVKPLEKVTNVYWVHWHYIDKDGTISIKGSAYDDNGHSSVLFEFPPSHPKYAFWTWLTEHSDYQRILQDTEVEQAEMRYVFESGIDQTEMDSEADNRGSIQSSSSRHLI